MKVFYDTYIKPYLLVAKLAGLAVLFAGGVWLGFRMDPDTDCGQLDAEVATELATLRAANASYEELEKARATEAAKEQAGYEHRMANEIKAAVAREQSLAKQLAIVKEELKRAKDDPRCADLMELEVCDAITIPLQPR